MANLRTTGVLGFRPDRIDIGPLTKNGWVPYFKAETIRITPHYQAYLWACFLWAYHHTGNELFYTRTETGAEVMTHRADTGRVFSVAFSPDGKTIAVGAEGGFTMLWESMMSADGYEPRRTGAAAKKIVDELHKKHGFYNEVINKLKD